MGGRFRREFLETATGSAALGLAAGCTGNGSGRATGTAADGTDTGTDAEAEGTTADGTTAGSGTARDGGTTTDGPEEVIDFDGQVAANAPESLAVTSRTLYRSEDGQVAMRGIVENTGDRAFSNVRVTVSLENDQGDTLFESGDETEAEDLSRLEPGNIWRFKVVFEEVDRLSSVTGYTIALDGTKVEAGAATGNATTTGDESDV